MKITIDIPDRIVGAADAYLKGLQSQHPVPRGDEWVIARAYPNGFEDWVSEIISEALLQLPPIAQLDEIQSEEAAIREALGRKKERMRPTVTRDSPSSLSPRPNAAPSGS